MLMSSLKITFLQPSSADAACDSKALTKHLQASHGSHIASAVLCKDGGTLCPDVTAILESLTKTNGCDRYKLGFAVILDRF